MGIRFREKPMGQRYAKHQMQSGVRLYHQRRHQHAIDKWKTALRRLNAEDRFITLGYMAQAFCDAGDYENMLHYALQQMELANARQDDFMKSEAFLNLSKACERLADFSKAIMYGKASLQHPSIDPRTPGYAYLTIALAYMGFSQFQSSLDSFEKAMNVANQTGDKLLELQICVGLGSLFTLLRDLSKALIFLKNALSILQLVTVDNIYAKYKSLILYHLSVVLRVKGSLVDAREACEESIRLSQETNSKSIYARCLASLADIYRELGESEARETITKSWARYEQAFRLMRSLNDRLGQVIVLGSMAKSASESRSHYSGQCECQAIQLNKKCLEIAKMIGCKHAMMKCHLRLQELYTQLSDEDSEEVAKKCATTLVQEMELFCNFCGQRYGLYDDSLQALRCSHIFHEKCLQSFLNGTENPACPKCQCKAILMDNISVRTSSVSSGNGTEQLPITANCIGPQNLPPGAVQTCLVGLQLDQPSTSAAAKKMMALQAQMAVDLDDVSHVNRKSRPSITIQKPSQETISDDPSRSVTPAWPSRTTVSATVHYPTPQPSTSKIREETPRMSSFSQSKSKSPKPPPPPRKPSCNVDSFPPLPEELLAAITNYQDPTNGKMPSVDEEGTYQVVSRGPGITDV